MEKAKTYTKAFILLTVAVCILYDFYAYMVGGTEATISWTVFTWSHDHPVTAFFTGFICGHLFWQMKGKEKIEGSNV